jgi:hypothetical protein
MVATRCALAALLLAGLATFAVLGTRDYLAWNRLRWTALSELMAEEKLTPADIDGGFEFNGLYLYDPAYKEDPAKSWYWVDRDSYVLSFGKLPGFDIIKLYCYSHWLPPYVGTIFVLKKNAPLETGRPTPTSAPSASPPARITTP